MHGDPARLLLFQVVLVDAAGDALREADQLLRRANVVEQAEDVDPRRPRRTVRLREELEAKR